MLAFWFHEKLKCHRHAMRARAEQVITKFQAARTVGQLQTDCCIALHLPACLGCMARPEVPGAGPAVHKLALKLLLSWTGLSCESDLHSVVQSSMLSLGFCWQIFQSLNPFCSWMRNGCSLEGCNVGVLRVQPCLYYLHCLMPG